MNDQIENHDPYTWKIIYAFVVSVFYNEVFKWGLHAMATLSTMVVCYFAFNWIKNKAQQLSLKYSWIKSFLPKK